MNRLFLAINPSATVRKNLAEYLPKAKDKLDRQGMRWTATPKFHVSLLTIGDQEIATVTEIASEIIKKHKAPNLTLTKTGGLPDTKRPGIVHVGVVDPSNKLAPLQAELATALGDPTDEYAPHVVLGRMKPASTKLGHKLRDFMHSGAVPEESFWTPENVVLYNLEADGNYTLIAEFNFSHR
jgi:2'-5' RNA ligase